MVLYFGSIIPKKHMDFFKKNTKVTIPESSQTHQRAILEGLKLQDDVYMVDILPCGTFLSRFRKAFIHKDVISETEVVAASMTIPVLRGFHTIASMLKETKKCTQTNEIDAIVVYMPFVAKMFAISLIKRRYKNIPIVVIVPDLIKHSYHQFGNKLVVATKRTIRSIQGYIAEKLSKNVDGFVYLTEKMNEHFGKNKKYVVLEAVYQEQEHETNIAQDINTPFTFLYCGKVIQENGIDRLIEAFMSINNQNCQLHIYGAGDLLAAMKEKAEADHRIVFMGQVSHADIIDAEKHATVLVNPRYTYLPNAAYSFPSKLIEYMACGKPVISSKLAGIPSDYNPYLFYIKDDTAKALKTIMEYTLEMDPVKLAEIGEKNRRFVRDHKSSKAQGKVLHDFIRGLQ